MPKQGDLSLRTRGSVALLGAALLACFVAAAPAVAQPSNDDFDAAVPIASLPYQTTMDVSGATRAEDDPIGCGNVGSVWFVLTPGSDMAVHLSTAGSDYAAVMDFWTGSRGSLEWQGCSQGSDGDLKDDEHVLHAVGGTTYYVEVSGFYSVPNTLVLAARQVDPPPNDEISGAITLADAPSEVTVDATLATPAPTDPSPCSSTYKSVWFKYRPTQDHLLVSIDTSASDYQNAVAIFRGPPNHLIAIGCQREFNASANTTYYIMVTSDYNDIGYLRLALTEPIRSLSIDREAVLRVPADPPYPGAVTVTVTGRLACEVPTTASEQVFLSQRGAWAGYGEAPDDCGISSSGWEVSAWSDMASVRTGAATATVGFNVCGSRSCVYLEKAAIITIKASP